MPLSIIIDAPIDKVYEVLDTPALNSIWNPVIDKITEDTPGNCTVESFMGNFKTSKATTQAPNRSITLTITGSPLLRVLKYELVDLQNNQTKVDGTVVLTAHYPAMHKSVGIELLHNLKRYIEFRTHGGKDPDFQRIMKNVE